MMYFAFAYSVIPGDANAETKFARQKVGETLQPEANGLDRDFVPPARFFTIKQVLAKLDAGALPATSGRSTAQNEKIASISNANVQSDSNVALLRGSLYSDDPFGLSFFRAPEGVLWQKWRQLEADIEKEIPYISSCASEQKTCTPAADKFARILHAIKANSGRASLEAANRLINGAIRYTSDLMQHGVLDRWSGPLATFESGRGDCEDYAIAKYVALRQAGVAPDSLKLLLVRDRMVREDHAVLAVRHEGRWLILDNRNSKLEEDTHLRHFTPLFALDHEGVKLFAAPYVRLEARKAINPAAFVSSDDNWFPLQDDLRGSYSEGGTSPLLL